MAVIDGSGQGNPRGFNTPQTHPGGRQGADGSKPARPKDPGTDSPADESTVTIPLKMGDPTPEEVKAWYNAHVPYENVASDAGVAERALALVKGAKRNWEDKLVATRDKWRATQWMMRGNSLSRMFPEAPIHVPEVYKKREALAVRIEEAVMDYDPWFRVMGRESMDTRQEDVIRAYLDYQLDSIRYQDHHGARIRCMLDYGFCALKIWMGYEEVSYVKRDVEKVDEEGKPSYLRIKRERTKRPVFKPVVKLIDPLDFVIDPSALDVEEATYVGDSCDMTFDEIMSLARLGVYDMKAAESLRGMGRSVERWTEYDRFERSLMFYSRAYQYRMEGAPPPIRVTEFWLRFDPYETGETAEYVITTANDDTVLRVQENPHDSKMRPYAIARCVDDAYEFLGVGPFDHAIRLNIELDEHRNLALKSHRRALAPFVVTREDTEWGDTLWDIDDGAVLRGGDFQVIATPDTWSNMQNSEATIKLDIDEVTGSPKHHMGTQASDETATNAITRVQEGNKRIQSFVRAYSRQQEQVLRILHLLNRQYVTTNQKFRVLGKGGDKLSAYEEITPQTFEPEIDFEFVGLTNLAMLGQRATNIQNFMNFAAPYSQQHPQQMDMIEGLRSLWRMTIGDHPAEKKIFKSISLDDMVPQSQENIMLAQGQEVEVHQMDNDLEHLREIDEAVNSKEFAKLPPRIQAGFLVHGAKHEAQLQKKRQQAQAAMAPDNRLMPPSGDAGVNGTFGNPQNGLQMSNGVAQTPPGENPGPPDASKVAAPGRQGPTPQTQNRYG